MCNNFVFYFSVDVGNDPLVLLPILARHPGRHGILELVLSLLELVITSVGPNDFDMAERLLEQCRCNAHLCSDELKYHLKEFRKKSRNMGHDPLPAPLR